MKKVILGAIFAVLSFNAHSVGLMSSSEQVKEKKDDAQYFIECYAYDQKISQRIYDYSRYNYNSWKIYIHAGDKETVIDNWACIIQEL